MKTAFSAELPSPLAVKRAAFPLRGPRYQTLAFWPLAVVAAAIEGYHAAFFMSLTPAAAGTVSLADAVLDGRPL